MKKKLMILSLLSMFLFGLNINVNAEYVDNDTPKMEQYEDDYVENEYIQQPRARAALSIPKEGEYDTIKDTKNSAGVMTERRYYKKNVLVEKRTYTSTGSTNCRMRNKYLYYSNGSTVYIHRTYSNTGATCYNLQSKRYGTSSQIQLHSIYEGKVDGKVIENRYYEITGTYYTQKAFYKAGTGVVYQREYWKGAAPNRITHIGNYNSVGSVWINATYYYYPNAEDKKEYITYTGSTANNVRKTATGYREDGTKEWYKQYNSAGQLYHMTYYNAKGTTKTIETRMYPEEQVREWQINYQANGVDRKSVTYKSEDNVITKTLSYYDGNNGIEWETLYNEDGYKETAKRFESGTGKLKEDIIFQKDNKTDIRTYYDTDGVTIIRKIRYFKDGSHLRWDINYENGEKKSVKLYDDKNDYGLKQEYEYEENDKELEKQFDLNLNKEIQDQDQILEEELNNYELEQGYHDKNDVESDNTYDDEDGEYDTNGVIEKENNYLTIKRVFDDSIMASYISERIDLPLDDRLFFEDLKVIDEIIIENEELKDLTGLEFLNNVEILKINNSSITEINDSIKYLDKLKKLDLCNNEIATLSKNITYLKELREIILSKNNINDLSGLFIDQKKLQSINIENNPIISFDADLLNLKKNGALREIKISADDFKIKDVDFEDISQIYQSELFIVSDGSKLTIKDTNLEKFFPEDNELNYNDIIVPKIIEKYFNSLSNEDKKNAKIRLSYLSSVPLMNLNEDEIEKINSINNEYVEYKYTSDILARNKFDKFGTYRVEILFDDEELSVEQIIYVACFEEKIDETSDKELANIVSGDDIISQINSEANEIDTLSQKEKKETNEITTALDDLELIEDEINTETVSMAANDLYGGAYVNEENNIVIQATNNKLINEIEEVVTENKLKNIETEIVNNSYKDLLFYSSDLTNQIGDISANATISVDEEINGLIVSGKEEELKKIKNSTLRQRTSKNIEVKYVVDETIDDYDSFAKKQSVYNGRSIHCQGYNENAMLGFRGKIQYSYTQVGKVKIKTLYGATSANHLDCKLNTKIIDNDLNKNIGRIKMKNSISDTLFIQFNNKFKPTKYLNRSDKRPYDYVTTPKSVVVKGAPVIMTSAKLFGESKTSIWKTGKITSTNKTNWDMGTAWYIGHIEVKKYDSKGKQVWTTVKGDSGGPLILDKYYKNKKKTIRRVIGTLAGGNVNTSLYVKSSTIRYRLGIIPY